jgi:DNA-binding protein H-NS
LPVRSSKDKSAKQRARRGAARVALDKLPDLSALSEDELTALAGLVEQELAGRRDQKRKDFFVSIRAQAQALGVAPDELAAELARKPVRGAAERGGADGRARNGTDRRATVAPKYRNPNNPSQTWAGRGVKPRWMQALLAQGASMEEFRIEH